MSDSEWTRERQSFSCTDTTWTAAKAAWAADRATHPAWTDWLEHALAEAADATEHRTGALRTPPERIPPGRSVGTAPAGRRRRSFTCRPTIWARTRAAWWTDIDTYPQLSDWIEAAIATKAHLPAPQKGPQP
ncbi:hypothetical protein [uncultured Gordonia sp.]|uniref:hypothetical protein n=1 Tax=uncultured Gordonia sp. TaxID=198437 RepID=UPI002587053D|nr:hypothetical protein [uncultured Gordonia sp.]